MLAAHQAASAPARPAGPEVVNTGPVLELVGAPPPLVWDGIKYSVPLVSYRAGLKLQELLLAWQAMRTDTPLTLSDLRSQAAWLDDALGLMWSLVEPRPPLNPFADASPQEVGQLLGFFLACQTMSGARSRFQKTAATSH